MLAYFYSFIKKQASTKRPTSTPVTESIQLKTPTSILSPTITLTGMHTNYNYVHIPDFNRYYFISNCTVVGLTTIYDLSIDLLASYKSIIETTVSRYNRTPFKNDSVVENLYSYNNDIITSKKTVSVFTKNPCFLIDVTCPDGQGVNPTTKTLVMTEPELRVLMSKLYDTSTYGGDTLDLITQTVADPVQYIRGVRYCPFRPDVVLNTSNVKIGWTTIDFGSTPVYSIDPRYNHKHFTLTIEGFTKTRESLDTNMSNYTLYLVGHGAINIEPRFATDDITIDIYVSYDTGETYTTLSSNNVIFKQLNGRLMSPISLSAVTGSFRDSAPLPLEVYYSKKGIEDVATKTLKSIPDLGSKLMNAFSAFSSAPAVAALGVGEGIVNAHIDRKCYEIGSNGSIAEFEVNQSATLVKIACTYINTPHVLIGYSNDYIGVPTENGFYRVSQTPIAIDGLKEELDALISQMHEGFYLE